LAYVVRELCVYGASHDPLRSSTTTREAKGVSDARVPRTRSSHHARTLHGCACGCIDTGLLSGAGSHYLPARPQILRLPFGRMQWVARHARAVEGRTSESAHRSLDHMHAHTHVLVRCAASWQALEALSGAIAAPGMEPDGNGLCGCSSAGLFPGEAQCPRQTWKRKAVAGARDCTRSHSIA
jgi:hypothetical protein